MIFKVTLILLALNSVSLEKLDEVDKRLKQIKECENIKCPNVEEPVCAKLIYKNNGTRNKNPVYVVMINKCELNYVKCHEGLKVKLVSMKFCSHEDPVPKVTRKSNLRISFGRRRSKRHTDQGNAEPAKIVTLKRRDDKDRRHAGIDEKNKAMLEASLLSDSNETNETNPAGNGTENDTTQANKGVEDNTGNVPSKNATENEVLPNNNEAQASEAETTPATEKLNLSDEMLAKNKTNLGLPNQNPDDSDVQKGEEKPEENNTDNETNESSEGSVEDSVADTENSADDDEGQNDGGENKGEKMFPEPIIAKVHAKVLYRINKDKKIKKFRAVHDGDQKLALPEQERDGTQQLVLTEYNNPGGIQQLGQGPESEEETHSLSPLEELLKTEGEQKLALEENKKGPEQKQLALQDELHPKHEDEHELVQAGDGPSGEIAEKLSLSGNGGDEKEENQRLALEGDSPGNSTENQQLALEDDTPGNSTDDAEQLALENEKPNADGEQQLSLTPEREPLIIPEGTEQLALTDNEKPTEDGEQKLALTDNVTPNEEGEQKLALTDTEKAEEENQQLALEGDTPGNSTENQQLALEGDTPGNSTGTDIKLATSGDDDAITLELGKNIQLEIASDDSDDKKGDKNVVEKLNLDEGDETTSDDDSETSVETRETDLDEDQYTDDPSDDSSDESDDPGKEKTHKFDTDVISSEDSEETDEKKSEETKPKEEGGGAEETPEAEGDDEDEEEPKEAEVIPDVNCPKSCPARGVMVCAKCQHGVYKTFLSVCHMRMTYCHFRKEELELVSRYPCVMSAPYLSREIPVPNDGKLVEPNDDDRVFRFIQCREKRRLGQDPKCKFSNEDTDSKFDNDDVRVILDDGIIEGGVSFGLEDDYGGESLAKGEVPPIVDVAKISGAKEDDRASEKRIDDENDGQDGKEVGNDDT